MKNVLLNFLLLILLLLESCTISGADPNNNSSNISFLDFTDPRDGVVYKTVKIGTQTWFAENLRYSGNIIQVITQQAWGAIWNVGYGSNQPAWCHYDNNSSNEAVYGKLYNNYAVLTGKLCPPGWHIPSAEDWSNLYSFAGGHLNGGKLKSVIGWPPPNNDSTNETGFSALPGGYRDSFGEFKELNRTGRWWSSSPYDIQGHGLLARYLVDGIPILYGDDVYQGSGLSCRCLKD